MGALQSKLHESTLEAVKDGDTEKLKKLLSKGHDFYKHFEPSLLHVAAENGRLEIVKLILEAARNKFSSSKDILKAFPPEKNRDPIYYLPTPICLAACNDHQDVVEYLLVELHSESSAEEMGYPLHAAVKSSIDCLKVILKHKPHFLNQPNMDGYFAMDASAEEYIFNPNIDMLKFLIDYGADVNVTGPGLRTLLHTVAYSLDLSLLPNLLEKCNDINVRDSLGRTALFLAADKNNKENVRILLANGADPTIPGTNSYEDFSRYPNDAQMSPLIVAARRGYYEVFKILADVTPRHQIDCVVISNSISWCSYRCLDYLLSKGFTAPSSIIKDLKLDSSLLIRENFSSTIKILVENGSSFGDLVEIGGKKPFRNFFPDVYLRIMHTELLSLLLDYGVAEIHRGGFCSHTEMCDHIASSYAEQCWPDTQSAKSSYYEKLLKYFNYFPFAGFSDASKVWNKTVIPVVPKLSQICKWCIRCRIVQCHGRVLPEHIKDLKLPNTLAKLLFSSDCENTQRFRVEIKESN